MTFPLAAEALSLLALIPRRQHPPGPAHECLREYRVRMVTEDGREGYGCPCLTGPHEVLAARGTMRG